MTHRIRIGFVSALVASGMLASLAAGQAANQADEIQDLREQIAALQQEVAELRQQGEMGDQLFLRSLADPELAGLAALDQASQLDRDQRIQFLSRFLRQTDRPSMVRNTAFLMLAQDLADEGRAEERMALLERMLEENARQSRESQQPRTTAPPTSRIFPQWRDPGQLNDPTGRGLELELRSPRVYPGHPESMRRFEPYDYSDRYDYGRLPRPFRYYDRFDRPWFENPRWRPGWWD